ncbi:leucyl/phenylalanyl-tRNA--protein transferase [Ketobacter sp. MCCC 1A13808]|uniref:leucyl/phenylalanyl-tRNA--protein transferase n=1 Tax=Ketobacter sp. MCCC 1A13808 TaxID=2602738 RepID=UPI000F152F48|nr:leucyl/phenylalanyl-tRNA--protein transferase [Ketobacter sp. MCCC 1A13808]MVF10588.1 leucyl/phenylalanyl-tRNA--protein transferase [Ketobacter sp. MCCC 1A13808]RLP56012.1 MAG: leucyl/phenylalanyl-tRNA--protein transferase [Ketobacter sp.]
MIKIPVLDYESQGFPPIEHALADPDGLLAAGGDLRPERLIEAYSLGIFPWYSDDQPILWWSPSPRTVLFTQELHISRSLHKTLGKGKYNVTMDQAFESVIRACAAPRRDSEGTWITEDMIQAYMHLHSLGYAHSVETWLDDQLVGGLYGIALGTLYFGESMFSRADNASKIAFVHLVGQLKQWGFPIIDCQVGNPHLSSLGARPIKRSQFKSYLSSNVPPLTKLLTARPPKWELRWKYSVS